jgi:SAM-dependent methyltransferase
LLGEIMPGDRGLNLACGTDRLHPQLLNVDRARESAADLRADAHRLPFARDRFQLIISQETLEHLEDPFAAAREMSRVLAPGGVLYLQVPFLLGYHPGPQDYWRFTGAGVRRVLEQAGLRVERLEPALGAGTGLYRVVVEFLADAAASLLPSAYLPVKGVASLLCFPLRAFDGLVLAGPQRDRIPGGYLAVSRKPI